MCNTVLVMFKPLIDYLDLVNENWRYILTVWCYCLGSGPSPRKKKWKLLCMQFSASASWLDTLAFPFSSSHGSILPVIMFAMELCGKENLSLFITLLLWNMYFNHSNQKWLIYYPKDQQVFQQKCGFWKHYWSFNFIYLIEKFYTN